MTDFIRGKVSGAGRVVLPSELRRELGIEAGADVIFSRTEHGIAITTLDRAHRQAQEDGARYVPKASAWWRTCGKTAGRMWPFD